MEEKIQDGKIWKIYKHTCTINGKIYIGQTNADKVNQRRWSNGRGYSKQSYF